MGQKKSKKSITTMCSPNEASSSSSSETNSDNKKVPSTLRKSNQSIHSSNSGEINCANYSPPRGLKDIFSSKSKSLEFETFLAAIDEENEDQVMVTRLKFVLRCRLLGSCVKHKDIGSSSDEMQNTQENKNLQKENEIRIILKELQESFFNKNLPEKRVALENCVLRERCEKLLDDALKEPSQLTDEMTETMLQIIVIKGQQDATKLLEPVHQNFLQRRQKQKMSSACGVNNACSTGKEVLRRLENCIL